tara:strand:- start:308 stop:556 length:249 start_codon:yes stop_codon:yes gene_type:complete
MINFKSHIPELDYENAKLFQAAAILEEIGNDPNPTANEFLAQLVVNDLPQEDHDSIFLAAMAIETMMAVDNQLEEYNDPTVH